MPSALRFRFAGIALVAVSLLSGCADSLATAPVVADPDAQSLSRGTNEGARGVFQRYVAIGTSVSMGWASDGVVAETQYMSWPLQLARRANREMSAPFIAFPGCRSPFRAPLLTFSRVSGESVAIPAASLSCAPLDTLATGIPAANTAINAARASDALRTTPENITDLGNKQLYARVLPPHTTQVVAMERQRPKFVSVELGANEVLGAIQGRVVRGVNVERPAIFAANYSLILHRVARTVNTGAVLVGLINDVRELPSFREGRELWLARAQFGPFGVVVQPDCENSPNLLFIPQLVPAAVARAGQTGQPAPLSCAASADPNAVDYILSPTEVTQVNTLVAQLDGFIQRQAQFRRWAYFRLEALYGKPGVKGPFIVGQLMASPQPYGPYFSLDGVHPSALGQTVLADAAAHAINARYNLGLPVGTEAMIAGR